MAARPPIYLYTDGASSGNPGPGGWGAVLCCGNYRKELIGGDSLTTNNRMELMAVIHGLECIRWRPAVVHVVSDSSYVVKAYNENWILKWRRTGFAKVKNPDLWMRLDALVQSMSVTFHWVKGHAGHPENERCDAMAVAAGAGAVAAGVILPADPGYVPEQ